MQGEERAESERQQKEYQRQQTEFERQQKELAQFLAREYSPWFGQIM